VLLKPQRLVYEGLVRSALLEDVGHGADLTTDAIVPGDAQITARIAARKAGIVAGLDASVFAFELLDRETTVEARIADGDAVAAGGEIARVRGSARAILTGERTALNVLGRLCGIATATRELVDLVAGTKARIVCTRKTTPGWRALERYAVRCGGGSDHRFGLDDAVLVKDNHIAVAGSLHGCVAAVRASVGHMVKVEVEVDTLDQLREALLEPVDAVLLDNMSPDELHEAVGMVNGKIITEASGGITKANVAEIASTGVDLISAGWLTHSSPALDVGLDIG
jgi:nicotinate-nucleotide pyrophosphorylase (carboxylating)